MKNFKIIIIVLVISQLLVFLTLKKRDAVVVVEERMTILESKISFLLEEELVDERFSLVEEFNFKVPSNYDHETEASYAWGVGATFVNSSSSEKTQPLIPGEDYLVRFWEIKEELHLSDCLSFIIVKKGIVFPGTQGLSLLVKSHHFIKLKQKREIISLNRISKGFVYMSPDEETRDPVFKTIKKRNDLWKGVYLVTFQKQPK